MASGGSCKPATHQKCTECQILSTCVLGFALQDTGGTASPSNKCRNNRCEGKSVRKEMVRDMEELKEPAITWSTLSPHIIKALKETSSTGTIFNSWQCQKLTTNLCSFYSNKNYTALRRSWSLWIKWQNSQLRLIHKKEAGIHVESDLKVNMFQPYHFPEVLQKGSCFDGMQKKWMKKTGT